MRVIAGKARRLPLKTIEGLDTRPTTDRIKETLFNILQNDLYDIRFLDIFSGSGGIGIEALSRGASEAYFIENNRAAAACIKENLKFTHLDAQATLLQCDVLAGLGRLEGQKPFQIIFMDPPYNHQWEKLVLEYLSGSSLLADDGVIIIEASKETETDYIEGLGFKLIKIKDYKTNKHIFIEK